MDLQEKEIEKDKSLHQICLERTYRWKVSVNSRPKAIKIIGQSKGFYRQRIPKFSCTSKETVDIHPCNTYGDRKIMQSIRITIRPEIRKSNRLSQFR